MLQLRPLLNAEITLAPPQELGDTPQGRRRIINMRSTPLFETGDE